MQNDFGAEFRGCMKAAVALRRRRGALFIPKGGEPKG